MIDAQVICDSISPQNHRLTTSKLKYPRFIHSEFMTHRALSRNASSSRAIPFAKQVQQVRDDATRAAPVYWGAEQKGMQTGEELMGDYLRAAKNLWEDAALLAANTAEHMAKIGLHKSICNRVIEPYTHITVIASATDAGWMNFFGLRLDAAAEPTMRALAVAMWDAYKANTPKLLQPGEWHTPFATDSDGWTGDKCGACGGYGEDNEARRCNSCGGTGDKWDLLCRIKVSVARCARVSYESFDTGRRSTVEEDLKLYDRLVGAQPLHASPAEHQATPDQWTDDKFDIQVGDTTEEMRRLRVSPKINIVRYGQWAHPEQHGNFYGFRQYRKMLPGEAVAPLPKEYT